MDNRRFVGGGRVWNGCIEAWHWEDPTVDPIGYSVRLGYTFSWVGSSAPVACSLLILGDESRSLEEVHGYYLNWLRIAAQRNIAGELLRRASRGKPHAEQSSGLRLLREFAERYPA